MATGAQIYQAETPSVASPAEGRKLFHRQARRLLGLSGEEFLRRWDASDYGNIPDAPESRGIMSGVYLIAFGRQDL